MPSFAEIAVGLFEYANHQARLNELAEELVARSNAPEVQRLHGEKLRQAVVLGEAYKMFRAMSDHEEQIRALIVKESIRLRITRLSSKFWTWLTTLERDPQRRIAS